MLGCVKAEHFRVKPKHYIPAEDFLSLEAEDGKMNEYQVVYDFKEDVFVNGFHGKGYATLGSRVVSGYSE